MPEFDASSIRRSDAIGNLASALAKAQGLFVSPKKDKTGQVGNAKTRYADLASVVEAVRVPLAENELAFTQFPSTHGSIVTVATLLMHSSGEWLEGSMEAGGGTTPQAIGSCVSYLKRYALCAILGVAPDDDDDGKAATEAAQRQEQRGAPAEPPARRTEGLTPAKALFNRVKDASSNADVAQSLRALSEDKKKALTVREFDNDREWAQMVSELLDALTTDVAA